MKCILSISTLDDLIIDIMVGTPRRDGRSTCRCLALLFSQVLNHIQYDFHDSYNMKQIQRKQRSSKSYMIFTIYI